MNKKHLLMLLALCLTTVVFVGCKEDKDKEPDSNVDKKTTADYIVGDWKMSALVVSLSQNLSGVTTSTTIDYGQAVGQSWLNSHIFSFDDKNQFVEMEGQDEFAIGTYSIVEPNLLLNYNSGLRVSYTILSCTDNILKLKRLDDPVKWSELIEDLYGTYVEYDTAEATYTYTK